MNLEIERNIFNVQYKNVINVLKFLLKHRSFTSNLKYALTKVYNVSKN